MASLTSQSHSSVSQRKQLSFHYGSNSTPNATDLRIKDSGFQNTDVIRPIVLESLRQYVPHPADQASEDPMTSAWDDIQNQVRYPMLRFFKNFSQKMAKKVWRKKFGEKNLAKKWIL
jgi:hypothetical protein